MGKKSEILSGEVKNIILETTQHKLYRKPFAKTQKRHESVDPQAVSTPFQNDLLTVVYRSSQNVGDGRVVRWCWINVRVRGVLQIWIRVWQGPTALAVGAGGGCLDIFLSSIISLFFRHLSRKRPDID